MRECAEVVDRGYRLPCRQCDELVAPVEKKRIRANKERGYLLSGDGLKGGIKLPLTIGVQNKDLLSERVRCGLHVVNFPVRIVRIHEISDDARLGHQLAQQLQSLTSCHHAEYGDTSHVATGPIETGN